MYAQCPQCLTFFHLKPAHLKAAQGRVRCSRCKHVFNALETLRDELSAEEIAAIEAARQSETKPGAPPASEDAVGDLFDGLDYTANEELRLGEPETPTEEEEIAAATIATKARPHAGFAASARRIEYFGAPRARSRHPVLLAFANVVLLLVLAGQLVHAERQRLSEQPLAGPYLARMYAALGQPIEPPRDIEALRVRRTEVGSHPEHARALRLTAVLENMDDSVQPWPELHVDLQDRWGETVGARYFSAAEYLRDKDAVDRPLPPRGRFTVELAIADPGSDAVGFQVRACFRDGEQFVCSGYASR